MQAFSNIRRMAFAAAIISMILLASCASSNTQKYGCPNHLESGSTSFSN